MNREKKEEQQDFSLPDGDARLYTNSKHYNSLFKEISDAYCNVEQQDFSLPDLRGYWIRKDKED